MEEYEEIKVKKRRRMQGKILLVCVARIVPETITAQELLPVYWVLASICS
jgi:hypothetical protein